MPEHHRKTEKKVNSEQEGFSQEDREFLEAIRELPEEVKASPDFLERVMETIKQCKWVKNEETRREQNDTNKER